MSKIDDNLRYEEEYFSLDRKSGRKERRLASQRDRSKYKKTDQAKLQKIPPNDPSLRRGRVLAIRPEGILVEVEKKQHLCQVRGLLKKEKTKEKNIVAVGDYVLIDPKKEMIVFVEERTSYLARADNLSRRKMQLIAVNIDQVFIIASFLLPKLKPPLIDRYIIAAKKGNMQPIIVINKIDFLTTPHESASQDQIETEKELFAALLEGYMNLDIPFITVSAYTDEGLDELKGMMQGKTSVFSGQSGVGKSTLINALLGTQFPIGDVIEKTRKGMHTTSTAELTPLAGGGFCIDTPGIKSFGMWDLQKAEIQNYFPEFAPYKSKCKFPDCTHEHEPECAVIQAIKEGEVSHLRYDSYLTLLQGETPKEWE